MGYRGFLVVGDMITLGDATRGLEEVCTQIHAARVCKDGLASAPFVPLSLGRWCCFLTRFTFLKELNFKEPLR